MPHACTHHVDAVFIGGGDHFIVVHRVARLNDRGDPRRSGTVQPVVEGKKAPEAITEPATFKPASAALIAAMRALETRLIWPAPAPTVIFSLA
jgi:hypothetical protein